MREGEWRERRAGGWCVCDSGCEAVKETGTAVLQYVSLQVMSCCTELNEFGLVRIGLSGCRLSVHFISSPVFHFLPRPALPALPFLSFPPLSYSPSLSFPTQPCESSLTVWYSTVLHRIIPCHTVLPCKAERLLWSGVEFEGMCVQ